MYNARRMSRFFPTEHGEEFLSEWYDWETEKQPQIPDADFVPLEAAGDGEIPEVIDSHNSHYKVMMYIF